MPAFAVMRYRKVFSRYWAVPGDVLSLANDGTASLFQNPVDSGCVALPHFWLASGPDLLLVQANQFPGDFNAVLILRGDDSIEDQQLRY